ncbi:MAG TPA: PASTA domain-containing protein [Solirubrobacteraceae bacterium]|nr:PASTA domain-containing protein [Solirubrobacteraceae bacterium]
MSLQATRLCPTCGRPDPQFRDFCPRCGEYLRWEDDNQPRTAVAAPAPPLPSEPPTEEMPAPVSPPAPVLLLLDTPSVTVAAGGAGTLRGLIRNQSGLVDNYDFRVAGLPAEWVGPAPTAYLLPFGSGDGGHEAPFELVLTPPRAPEAEARPWPLEIEAVSRSTGAVAARASATLVVEPYEELGARAQPQRRRGRRGGTYAIEVSSRGNAPAVARLSGADTDAACDVRIDPPALQIAPGAVARARVRVKPHRTLWWGRPVEHRIDVDGPVPQSLAFRQLPWIPWWVPVAVAMIVALVIALLALRGDPPIPVPEVRGQTVDNAQALLVDAGLKATPRLQEQVVDDPRQVGRVIAQNPAAGSEIDADGAVILQTGVANQTVGVPQLRGATLDQAQQILSSAGLTLGVIEPGDAPGDALVDFQNPAAGDEARLGSPVTVRLAVQEDEATPTPTPTATPTATAAPEAPPAQ